MFKKINLKSFWQKLDKNLLLILSSLLLIVIPLYPKLPLFDVIPGYIVRVRLEDFLILFTIIVLFIQAVRKKVTLKTPLTKIIVAYAVVGLLSTISGIFLTKTIPMTQVHVLKSFLHYLRYLEYFSLFFIFYASIKSKKDLKTLIYTSFGAYFLVGIYGIGQKYLYWPVYSTMNREFSKGITLYLTEHARVQSTFGGHYDLAAYIVILLPIIFILTQFFSNKLFKLFLWLTFSIGIWLMVMSASRTSFIAAIVGILITILLRSFQEKKVGQKIKFFISKSIITGSICIIIFSTFGDDISERLLQSLNNYPIFSSSYIVVTSKLSEATQILSSNISFINPFEQIQIDKPKNGLSTDVAEILIASDTRPSPIKPSDVFVDVPNQIRVATVSATGETSMIVIEVPRTYSENAIKHGLSLAIRLDTLWPQAIKGFYSNPLLGSGYATLTKSQVDEFTEADSTDNNFLRTLGETGLLGFISFYGIIIISISNAFKIFYQNEFKNNLKSLLAIAFIGSSIGLLINALFIDVFAASKVALTFWAITGILFALNNIKDDKVIVAPEKKRKRKVKGKFSNTPK
ncbi:MAG: O-antigen ligase family protein [Pseudomonadales bacterium]|nr:O-antigen ligase family protein [Pseudomonadales bacterium]